MGNELWIHYLITSPQQGWQSVCYKTKEHDFVLHYLPEFDQQTCHHNTKTSSTPLSLSDMLLLYVDLQTLCIPPILCFSTLFARFYTRLSAYSLSMLSGSPDLGRLPQYVASMFMLNGAPDQGRLLQHRLPLFLHAFMQARLLMPGCSFSKMAGTRRKGESNCSFQGMQVYFARTRMLHL